ncbi:beta-lactamase family protein [Saccharopolyspora sp. K220]|uniref:serine hydrolase domain-containing protein n=1 Tax=Saccharopolyspora soli TaxID=2926618 RepID=UPI001F563A94|nr:serine hydrolase domain-containing protein [Saccharopolyspora soli]MCI2417682.1 beta-lactamase family protein [Saccharopolyspora soli]
MPVAAGFERVAAEFAEIVADDDAGAAFTVFRDGAQIVDLQGGHRNPEGTEPMTTDTLMPVFSGTKGLVATGIALLIDSGSIDPEAPVARYWPEFGAAGKQDVEVRQLLSHSAGLPYPQRPVTREESTDNQAMAALLAAQRPLWPVGTTTAYHALTYGWLAAELVRRVDGREIGEYLRTELAERIPADCWLGLPESEWTRTGRRWRAADYQVANRLNTPEALAYRDKVYGNPPTLLGTDSPWNTPAWWRSGTPGGGAMASSRGMAAVYSALVSGKLVSAWTLDRIRQEESRGTDPGTGRPLVFGLGYELQDSMRTYGPEATGFGHSGAGGSLFGCWPRLGVAFAFSPCLMRTEGFDNRSHRLLTALHTCL